MKAGAMKKPTVIAVAILFGAAMFATSPSAATLKGNVRFSGKPPKVKTIRMKKDPVCVEFYQGKKPPRTESTVINENSTVRWAFVYIQEKVKNKGKKPAPPSLDQQGCLYTPRVFGMMAGQKLKVTNSDSTKHNFHLLGKNKYNRSAGAGKTVTRKIKKAGSLKLKKGKSRVMAKIKCDIHPWMIAYVGVLPHSYFSVTGASGEFEIKGLPAGEYTLVAWHEKLGTLTQKITVGGDETKTTDFTFKR